MSQSKPVQHPALRVKASLPRRYRAGLAFGAEPVTIEAGTLTEEQLKAVVSDPFLGVTELADEKKKVKPPKPEKDGPAESDPAKGADLDKKGG
jgi:hypothetical protein